MIFIESSTYRLFDVSILIIYSISTRHKQFTPTLFTQDGSVYNFCSSARAAMTKEITLDQTFNVPPTIFTEKVCSKPKNISIAFSVYFMSTFH